MRDPVTDIVSLLTHAWPALAVAVLAGPLIAAGSAKIITRADRIAWPLSKGPLRAPYGPRIVGLAELVAAVAIAVLPWRFPALVAVAAYVALTVAAVSTRGQRCACFGLARLAAVGRLHIGLNAGAGLIAGTLCLIGSAGPGVSAMAAVAVASAAAVLASVFAVDRRRGRDTTTVPCDTRVSSVRLYVSDDCPSCRSLKHLLTTVEPARRDAVVTTVIVKEAELPSALQGLGVPCAQGVDLDGRAACAPASGIGGVKALIDSITVGQAAAVRGD
jgi:hypothetical protein